MTTQAREHGEIVIPSQEWVDVKEKVREGHNAEQARRYRLAISAYEMALAAKEADPDGGWKSAGRRVLERLDLEDAVRRAVGAAMFRNGPTKRPLKPRKLDFPEANNRTAAFDVDGEATLRFDNDTRTATWSVAEEGGDPDAVRRMPVPAAFFSALDAVGRKNAWTPQSGGEIIRSDEAGETRVVARYGTRANRENSARYGDSRRRPGES